MKIISKKLDIQIDNLSKDQKLLLFTGLFLFVLFVIYQLGIAAGKFYYYFTH